MVEEKETRENRERLARIDRWRPSFLVGFIDFVSTEGQLRTIPIALSILSNGVRKLAFHLFDLARWQLLMVGKEENKNKQQETLFFLTRISS